MKKGIKQNTIKKSIKVLIAVLALFLFNIDAKADTLYSKNFGYTGNYQTFTAPYSGDYKIELWGAGGTTGGNGTQRGGAGAYTSGTIRLNKDETLYIYVGGYNVVNFNNSPTDAGGLGRGGGATDVRLVSGEWKNSQSLASRIMVAAGGGGNGWSAAGGAAGGLSGVSGNNWRYDWSGKGATQTAGGNGGANYASARGSFGIAGSSVGGGTGGGGYYGGGSGYGVTNYDHGAAGGGSSFISGHNGCIAITAADNLTPKTGSDASVHYSGKKFTNTVMYAGNQSMPNTAGTGTMVGNAGAGYAKITLNTSKDMLSNLSVNKGSIVEEFHPTKTEYTWIVPKGTDVFTDEDINATPYFNTSQVIIPEEIPFEQDGDSFDITVIGDDETRRTYTVTMQRFVSSDASLSSITSDQGILSPAFDPDTTTYSLEFMNDLESITIDAEVNEQDSTVVGTGEITLDDNETIHNLTVTAEDGTIRVYKIKIYKNMYLQNIEVLGLEDLECEDDQCSLSPTFDPATEEYTINVPYEYTDLNLTYTPSYKNLTVGIRVDGTSYVKHQIIKGLKHVAVFNIYNSDNAIVRSYKLNIVKSSSLVTEFDYTRSVQSFTAPRKGKYKLETWGAQGSNGNGGGYGGYAVGEVSLNKGQTIYVYVGGQATGTPGGYNGGGNGLGSGPGGGGATHIATTNRGVLSTYNSYRGELLIVSGGGGAGSPGTGSGGGMNGQPGAALAPEWPTYRASEGSQTGAGRSVAENGGVGAFGQGGHAFNSQYGGFGGGGGYFGGGGTPRTHAGAGGGSGYIGNSLLLSTEDTTKHMACYGCATSTADSTRTISNTCSSAERTADCSKKGHGHATITLTETETMLKNLTVDNVEIVEPFDKFRKNYTWIIPKNVDTLTDDNVQATPIYESAQVIIPESVPYTQDGDKFKITIIGSDETRDTYTLTMQRYVSNDARLKSLTASEGVFTPEFDPDTDTYLLEIFDDVDSVTLSGEVNEQDATVIDGLGEITLEENETDHEITVQAEDGTIKVYSIRIRKNMYLKNIVVEGLENVECEREQCVLTPDFKPEIDTYKIKVPQDYDKLDVTYVPSTEDLTVGIRVNEANYVKNMGLQKASNEIKFNIYDKDNKIIKTYTLKLVREKMNSGKLRNLVVNKGRLTEEFHKNKEEYTWIIPKGTDVLTDEDVTVTLFDNFTHAEIPENVQFTKNGDKYEIVVTTYESLDYSYEGKVQEFTAPYTGEYKLETWGAQGGNANNGGYGGYSVGTVSLNEGDKIYIYVGGQANGYSGGYNGGGNGLAGPQGGPGGGGATHIATTSRGVLSTYNSYRNELLIVSGGGGAGAAGYGSGGGMNGQTGAAFAGQYPNYRATEGTQTAAGRSLAEGAGVGAFGQGGHAFSSFGGLGGGGGYFGGGGTPRGHAGAGGGSGYIGNSLLKSNSNITKHMTCYGCANSTVDSTRTISNSCHKAFATPDCAKEGTGYARVTLLDTDEIQMTKTYTLSLQREISDDTRLATLTTDKGFFTEDFDKDKRDYVLELYHHDTSVTFDGTPFEQDAEIIDGLGEVDLPEDEVEHEITVQAEDGTIGVYNIIIRRDMYIEDLGLNGLDDLYCRSYECHMTPEFSPEIENYDYRVPLDYDILDAYYEPASAAHRSEMTINGEPYVDGYVLPYTGTTVVQVHVYNDSDTIVKTYTMNVIKQYELQEEFDYTGDYQIFIAPRTGKYQLETWGAQGGSASGQVGGYGSYSTGEVSLNKGDKLYVYVGGAGVGTTSGGQALTGGYNGGGSVNSAGVNHQYGSGGGATHIATKIGLLSSLSSETDKILIVSGGGGGSRTQPNYNDYSAGARRGNGGHGGGKVALHYNQTGVSSWSEATTGAGTQTGGYVFGQGETATGNGAGGGGYYGGKTYDGSGSGGSGYIGNSLLSNKKMVMYATSAIFMSNDEATKTEITTNASESPLSNYAKKGNGYSKVRLDETETMLASLDVDSVNIVEDFDKFRTEYTWIIPKGVDDFTSDNIEAVLLHPEKAHIEWPSEPVHFNQDGDKFTFKVVADNGEEDTYTLTMVRYKSNDARLKTLETDKGLLTPEFDPDTDQYVIELFDIEDMIHLDGEPMDIDSTVVGLGDVPITSSEVTREIVVTAEDGTVKIYTVIIRDDSYLINIGLNGLDNLPCVEDECYLKPIFTPATKNYEISVPYEYTNLDAYYIIANVDNRVEIKVNGGNYSKGQALPVGETEVKYLVYNSNNVLVNTYVMNVIRQKGNYATLENLEVSVGELDIPFEKDTEEYTWIIPSDVSTNLENYIAYTKTDPGATVQLIPSTINYTEDGQTFDIKVTAEDGVTTKTYTITLQQDIIEDIEVDEEMIIFVGQIKNLYINGLPEGSVGKYEYEIEDMFIASVYDNGNVMGLYPGDTNITITVKNHPEIQKTVHLIVMSNKIRSKVLSVEDRNLGRIIIGENPETNINDFLDKIDNPREYLVVYDKDGNQIDKDEFDSTIVTTGMKVKLVIDGTEYDEVIAIIRGDIDQDGYVDISDSVTQLNHILYIELIDDYRLYAADVDIDEEAEEDEMIDISDNVKLDKFILGEITDLNE